MSDDAGQRPIKRIKQACRNCRRKKARCSGDHPICAFCRRLSQPCYYSDDEDTDRRRWEALNRRRDDNSDDSISKEELNHRLTAIETKLATMAEAMSCISNTLQNIKANSPQDQALSKDQNEPNETPNFPQPLPWSSAQSSSMKPPPMETILGAADIYFRYCHNQPYSLFHEESFRQRLAANEVPHHLLFAFLASSVRYSTDPYFEDKVGFINTYAMQSWKAMVLPWNGIESDAGISTVQTILLLAIIDYTDGKTQGAWIKVGLAIRIAQDFRLMLEPDSSLPQVQQEERRRVFWSFYIADKLISCGRERPPAILDENCKVRLPGDECAFRAGRHSKTATLDQLTSEIPSADLGSLSTFALSTVMASTLGRCAQYTLGEQENHGPGGQYSPWNPKSKFFGIHSTLLQLESDFGLGEPLTARIRRDFTGIDGSIDQHRAAPLVFARALFHLCQCLLYHPFLLKQRLENLGARPPLSFVTQAFDGCKAAALAMCEMMDEVKRLECEAVSTYYDPFYGYCTMVAGTIHALFLHSSDTHVVDTSTSSFASSMRNLEELSLYWKSSSLMIARLESFRENSGRYAILIDLSAQALNLSETDVADLVECLDYSRLSTQPRRKSQGNAGRALVSNLPSPFFDDFLNLLPLSNSRPGEAISPIGFTNMGMMSPLPDFTIPGPSSTTFTHDNPFTSPQATTNRLIHAQGSPTNATFRQPSIQIPVNSANLANHGPHTGGMPNHTTRKGPAAAETPYRRRESTSSTGRRPWYEQPSRTSPPDDITTLDLGQMMTVGELMH